MVRNSLFSQHPTFECSQSSIFQTIKSVSVAMPESLMKREEEIHIFPQSIPNCNIMTFPAGDGRINLTFGVAQGTPIDEEVLSKDGAVLAEYMKSKVPDLALTDEEYATIAAAGWYQTQQVTCSTYHLPQGLGAAVLLGDAAHATSPSMGQGLNTAIADAKVLAELLAEWNGEDIDELLRDFSDLRVKEGHALTDLSFYMSQLSVADRIVSEMRNAVRTRLNKWTNGWVK